jgi:hypothetical protein
MAKDAYWWPRAAIVTCTMFLTGVAVVTVLYLIFA